MNEDFENKKEENPEENKAHVEKNDNAPQPGSQPGRTPRPRINRQTRIVGHAGTDNSYSSYHSQNYRPRYKQENGEGNGYQRQNYYDREGGNQRQGYNPQGGYRPRYNQRPNGYQPRPHYNREGYAAGYASNPEYNQQRNGYTPREGYTQRNNWNGERNGYRPMRQGGYTPGGYNRNAPQRRNAFTPNNRFGQKRQITYKEDALAPDAPIRLNKFLANAGICSRRDADKYIEAGVVTVNGNVVTALGTKVLPTDNIMFHNTPVKIEHKVYILLNKPKGYVTTSEDPQNRKTVLDLIRGACPERVYPVGRLDRNTTGVLLLTNDGELAAKLTHPQYLKKKIYHVWLDRNLSSGDMQKIADGIDLEDGTIKADDIQYVDSTDKKQVGIEIHSGRNRIVRRIFESLGYHVIKLDRVFFAGLTKKHLRRGDWRFLTQDEVNFLRMGSFQ